MSTDPFSHLAQAPRSPMRLEDGSRVAVIGGGPAGSFFSFFLLDLAGRMGIDLHVDIYEPRDFSLPAPQGCNMCAGVISETLIQNLASEGINLPATVIQNAIDSYILHTDLGLQRLDAASYEKRIGVIFRGLGPRGIKEIKHQGFDDYLLALAKDKGANIFPWRVTGVERDQEHMRVTTRQGEHADYDLVVVAAGVNTALLKLFDGNGSRYVPPKSTKTAIREYHFDTQTVARVFGNSLHVFLLDIPRLDFAMIIPKGEYVSVCLLGKEVDDDLLSSFLNAPQVVECFPPGWRWDQPDCLCMPRVNVRAAIRPYADRLVFVGDSGVTRLFKDGIGTAYRSAKAAASCAILEGVSAGDFRRYYAPFCRRLEADNYFGKLVFFLSHIIQRLYLTRKAMFRMVADEQSAPGHPLHASNVLWDTFTGSAPYGDVFRRIMHPAFLGRFIRSLVDSVLGG